MSQTLGHVVPYLGELSGLMKNGMAVVNEDIVDEQASGDLFGQVMQELNVEIDTDRAGS